MIDGSKKKKKRGFPAKLETLPPHQQNLLRGWLCTGNVKYPAVQEKLKREFGVSVSIAGLHRYWRRHLLPSLKLPRKLPAEYVIERHTILKRHGAIVARTVTFQTLRNSGGLLKRGDALALAGILKN